MYTETHTATTRKPMQRDIAKNATDKKVKLKKKKSVNNPRGQEKGKRGTNRGKKKKKADLNPHINNYVI